MSAPDPVMELQREWARDSNRMVRAWDCAAALLAAIKLRPRGEQEQIEEIARLKSALAFEKNAYAGVTKDLGRALEQIAAMRADVSMLDFISTRTVDGNYTPAFDGETAWYTAYIGCNTYGAESLRGAIQKAMLAK